MKMIRNLTLPGSVALLVIVALVTAGAAGARAENKAVHGLLADKDYKFACEAAMGGQTEITLSQVALQKTANQSVKDFAQRMVQDHQKASDELAKLVTDKGATLPNTDTKKSEATAQHLQNLSGAEFDRAYMKDMVSDHKTVVKLFQKEAEHADDGDLKEWTGKTLPTLAEHLHMAENIEATLTGSKVATK
jgi:putative membrane protein